MTTVLNPYLAFDRDAREAMNFYHGVFGGDLVLTTFGDGGLSSGPADADLVMHAQLTTADGHTLMGSDSTATSPKPGGAQQVSISGDDRAALTRSWEGLSDGARVVEPLRVAPWGQTFGMLVDRWGITWMVSIDDGAEAPPA